MTRELLPQRRASVTFTFGHAFSGGGEHQYTATVGSYEDGRPGEIFLETGKFGTAIDVWARDSAVLASLALQHGCSIQRMRAALTREANGSPSGVIGTLLDTLAGHPPHDGPEAEGVAPNSPVTGSGSAAAQKEAV